MERGKSHEHKEERAMGTTLFDGNPQRDGRDHGTYPQSTWICAEDHRAA
jgi:hypothetical protein